MTREDNFCSLLCQRHIHPCIIIVIVSLITRTCQAFPTTLMIFNSGAIFSQTLLDRVGILGMYGVLSKSGIGFWESYPALAGESFTPGETSMEYFAVPAPRWHSHFLWETVPASSTPPLRPSHDAIA